MSNLEQAARQALAAFEYMEYDGKCVTALREALAEQAEQEPEVWYCPDCGTLSEFQVKCCPDWIRSRKVPKNFAITCKATFDRNVQAEQEPVALPFNCWSTNDGDSWYEHPADAQLIYDTLGDDAKVGDEFEVTAGWTCVTARYRIVSQDGDDFEVECISHPQDNAAPVRTKDLTDTEIRELWSDAELDITWFASAVIAKFKEKNK